MKLLSRGAFRTLALILSAAIAFSLMIGMPSRSHAEPSYVGPRGNSYDDPANGIYVSPSGNDSTANGSIGAPYRSINAALAAASPGNRTIILRNGTYREGVNVRVRWPNITIKSAKGEWGVIDLTGTSTAEAGHSGVYLDVDSSGSKLQSIEVMGGWYAVCLETKWDYGQADRSGARRSYREAGKESDFAIRTGASAAGTPA